MVTRIVLAFSLLCLLGLAYLFWQESQEMLAQEVTAWTEDHRADCGVVLTGGVGRVREGLDLLAHRSIKKLIISGVFPGAQLREIFPQLPYYSTVDPNDVILEKRSLTTFGNAQQSLALVEALRCRDVVLVTSKLHMPRAMKIFKAVFPVEFPIYPRALVAGSYHPKPFDLYAEVIKSLFYSLWAY